MTWRDFAIFIVATWWIWTLMFIDVFWRGYLDGLEDKEKNDD